ncbi:hypothetical protein [Acinetobacter thermotolerans]|uniref:hypothetical protein n=1 Tax=Acinetobacter thermotolerans TaxID=3151487 RepID=UPI00325B5553
MGYKQLSIDGTVQFHHRSSSNYQIAAEDIQMDFSKAQDDYGQVILIHELQCPLKIGHFHLVITTDKERIISVECGNHALGDGLYYDLELFVIRYGKHKFIYQLPDA